MIKKRVIFLRSNPVDPDPRVEKEVNTLIDEGYEVTIICWDRNNKYKVKESFLVLTNGKAKIYRLGIPATYGGGMKKNLKGLILFQINLIKWLFKLKNEYDIVHACDFDTAFVASKCCKLLKKKLIYDIFDYYVDSFSVPNGLRKIIEKLDHNIINKADHVIICSENRKQQIKGSIPKKLSIIHNTPINITNKINCINLNKDKVKIVYIGILSDGRLLKQLGNVIINNPNIELHIGGFGKLEDYFKDLSSKFSNIIFYGKVDYLKALELEKSCDIITAIYDPTIPNHFYAAPNKFYESIMLGKPLIMVKGTGMSDVVLKHNIGEIIEYNEESLESGINRLIARRDEWDLISYKMKEIYSKYYNWTTMDQRLRYIYSEIK